METYARTYEDLIRKIGTLSEVISPNLAMINFLSSINMSAYAPFSLAKRQAIRDRAAAPLLDVTITLETLVSNAIEEWQVIKNHKYYHGASAGTGHDKVANAAHDNNDKSKDTSSRVGKGLKDLYHIHTNYTKKHTNSNCWKQHPDKAPNGYANKGDKGNKNKRDKDKKKEEKVDAATIGAVALNLSPNVEKFESSPPSALRAILTKLI